MNTDIKALAWEARRLGMSYGQLVAQVDEEALADIRKRFQAAQRAKAKATADQGSTVDERRCC